MIVVSYKMYYHCQKKLKKKTENKYLNIKSKVKNKPINSDKGICEGHHPSSILEEIYFIKILKILYIHQVSWTYIVQNIVCQRGEEVVSNLRNVQVPSLFTVCSSSLASFK